MAAVPLWVGGAASPCNTMSLGPRPTSVPSGILIHETVWPQYTRYRRQTDRQMTSQDNSQTLHCNSRLKNLLNSNMSSTCPHNMVNVGPLMAEISSGVWGTPANFNQFRILTSLLHRRNQQRSTKICTMFGRLLGWYTTHPGLSVSAAPQFHQSRQSVTSVFISTAISP